MRLNGLNRYFTDIDDNHLTTIRSYQREPGRDYRYVGFDGWVHKADLPQPPNTAPLYVHNVSDPGTLAGLTRGADVTLPSGIRVRLPIATGGENSAMSNLAREMVHTIGIGWDTYGSAGLNSRYTLAM